MWLRRFQCVFKAFARLICGENTVRKRRNGDAKTVKMWCENGKIVVYFRRVQA